MIDEIKAVELIRTQYFSVCRHYMKIHNPFDGYSFIRREVDKLWEAVKQEDSNQAHIEAVHVAAMALRFLTDLG